MPTVVIKTSTKGGDKWKGVLAKIAAQNVGVKAGILAGATTADGQNVAEYAAYNEFGVHSGATRIPSRPFMRNTVTNCQGDWKRLLIGPLSAHPDGARAAMYIIGERMAEDIKSTIQAGHFTPLAEQTIERKRKAGKKEPETPLIDTGTMLKSVSYEVVEARGGEVE